MFKLKLLVTAMTIFGSIQLQAAIEDLDHQPPKKYNCSGSNNDYKLIATLQTTQTGRGGNKGYVTVELKSATAQENFNSQSIAFLFGPIALISSKGEAASIQIQYVSPPKSCGRGDCGEDSIVYKTVATLVYQQQKFIFICNEKSN